jgi:uncharacterized DUF497 family protein
MFEYDPDKSAANLAKHGIDFEQAQALWDDDDRLVILSSTPDEVRWMVIGRILERNWTAVCTDRDDAVRIISVRRSRDNEVRDYDSQKGD